MLKDADHNYFAGVYIVCGCTDLRFGIDSLVTITERTFHLHLFVPNTLFLFCGRSSTRIKGLLWKGDGFLLLYKRVELNIYFNLPLAEIPQHMDDKDLGFIDDLLPWSPRVQKECPNRYKKS